MGSIRNGARTALNLMAKVCQLSRLPGFRSGMSSILGPSEWASFQVPFDALCTAVDALLAADNYYNQIDYVREVSGSEDIGAP
jgi:hypothetical protein